MAYFVLYSKAPSQGVHDVMAPVISPNEISLMWIPPKMENWNGILTNYTVGNILCGDIQIGYINFGKEKLHLGEFVCDHNFSGMSVS